MPDASSLWLESIFSKIVAKKKKNLLIPMRIEKA